MPLARRVVDLTVSASLLLGASGLGSLASVQAQASATPSTITRAEYEACQTQDEAVFRKAIESVTFQSLERGLRGADYKGLVSDAWRREQFDELLAKRVDAAIGELKSETSWTDLIGSLAVKERAERLATSAAERVYRSEEIKSGIERMAVIIGKDVGRRVELAVSDAAAPATQCLQAFLGPRYGQTVSRAVSADAGKEFAIDAAKGTASVTAGQVLVEGKEGIAGTVILIVRRQLANLARRVGQRLVGAVLSRVVSVVAGGVGVVLVAKDIWDLRHGVLPIVAEEMKAPSTRDKVQEELARSVGEQIGEHLRDISQRTGERVVEIWLEFRRAHAKVLELAERLPAFKSFIDNVKPQNLARLDEIVALVLASESEAALIKRLEDGTLAEAVERMPAAALAIARDQRSLEIAFKWTALAGDSIDKLVEYELHRRNRPDELDRASLTRILALDDRLATGRLAGLKSSERLPLLELKDAELRRLARALAEPELASLSRYMTVLDRNAGQRLLQAVALTPAKMFLVSKAGVRDAILGSRDQSAAVGMMLRADSLFDVGVFIEDAMLVQQGQVSPWLLWARYPGILTVLAGLGLIVLLLLWRILFRRGPRIVVEAPRR